MKLNHAQEINGGVRFDFGSNWELFLGLLDESRINEATLSLQHMLGPISFAGKTFVDVGSGSGLFSLAARRLGADVTSFDFDPRSVLCTNEIKRRYFPEDIRWKVEEASVLDRDYLSRLGRFDIVYSWGVLHHTGAMWQAFENVIELVKENGILFVAIYNDQGWLSRYWKYCKKIYVRNFYMRLPLILFHALYLLIPAWLVRARRGRLVKNRGMSVWRDFLDWIGGYPFEVARPEDIFRYFRDKGFTLLEMKTTRRMGCNEFVFIRS
jgi:2-polyprenyl-3-methyl-5-hydroxy-6-metoxy-1,4-benzoquinol methylase